MRADQLHVITAISNPILWASRIRLYADFEQHMLDSGVRLTTVECTYGEHEPQIAANPHVNYVRVRASGIHKVWIKECLLNLGIAATADAKYIATVDADVRFRSRDWARDTVHALQHFHIIQPWAHAYDLGPNGEHINVDRSFCSLYYQKGAAAIHQGASAKHKACYPYAHTGYAWAYTRQALEWTGGLIETAALGSADHHMALALIGKVKDSIPCNMTDGYQAALHQWQRRMHRHLQGHIGYLPGSIEHFWHGPKVLRGYNSRWEILARNKFDPSTDLKRNTWGVLELAGNKPQLSHDIDAYFRSRNEDANSMG